MRKILFAFLLVASNLLVAQNKDSTANYIKRSLTPGKGVLTSENFRDAFSKLLNFTDSTRFKGYSMAQIKALPNGIIKSLGTVFCDEVGKEGFFKYDATDNTTADNAGLTIVTTGGLRLKRIVQGNSVSVKWFGAKGDGTTDDAQAIQNAVDYAVYIAKIPNVFIPEGRYVTSKTIHLGYGVSYNGTPYTNINLVGASYDVSGIGIGTRIITNFSNAPAINIQGCRGTKVSGIAFEGLNATHVQNSVFWQGAASFDPRIEANLVAAGLHANANSDTAPYAAICIDAYSGSAPAVAYPNVTFPSFLGTVSQYGKAPSSLFTIENCYINGFVVGVVLSPGGANGQCDFFSMKRSWIQNCVYGISIGHTDARENSIEGCYINQCHTALTTGAHGAKYGNWGAAVINTAMDRNIQWFNIADVGIPRGGPITFLNCYGETMYRIGIYGSGGGSTQDQTLILQSCLFKFTSYTGNLGYTPWHIKLSTNASLRVIGSEFSEYMRGITVMGNADNITWEDNLMSVNDNTLPSSVVDKHIHTATGGQLFIVPNSGTTKIVTNSFSGKFRKSYDMAGTLVAEQRPITSICESNRQSVICVYSKLYKGYSSTTVAYNQRNTYKTILKSTLASVALSGRTLTFTYTGRGDTDFTDGGLGVGDFLTDIATGSVFYVTSRTGTAVTAILHNNYYITGGSTVNIIDAISTTSGYFYWAVTRDYAPNKPLFGLFSSTSSPVITQAGTASGVASGLSELVIGDRLYVDPDTEGYTSISRAAIVAYDVSAKTITLANNALRVSPDIVRIWRIVARELPNE